MVEDREKIERKTRQLRSREGKREFGEGEREEELGRIN